MTIERPWNYAGDRTHQLILNRENVVQVAIIALRPQTIAGCRLQELRGYAEALTCSPNAAFHDITSAEHAADFLHIDSLALDCERGVPSGDQEMSESAEFGDDIFGQAIGKILLFRISAHVD